MEKFKYFLKFFFTDGASFRISLWFYSFFITPLVSFTYFSEVSNTIEYNEYTVESKYWDYKDGDKRLMFNLTNGEEYKSVEVDEEQFNSCKETESFLREENTSGYELFIVSSISIGFLTVVVGNVDEYDYDYDYGY